MRFCDCNIIQDIIIDFITERIEDYYLSDADFSKAAFKELNIKAPAQRWNRIKNGPQNLRIIDVCLMAKALHMDLSHLISHCCELSKSLQKPTKSKHKIKKIVKKMV